MRNSYRKIKKVRELLRLDDFDKAVEEIGRFPARKAINQLISLLYSTDERMQQRAVTMIGIVVSRLAVHDIESARVIMRRLMWSLNDESGGIGWGAPEAMAEIMTRNDKLADEYHKILISYAVAGANYLEHEALQRSVQKGIKRLASKRPEVK
jgi:flagellin-specific chaperone FliS